MVYLGISLKVCFLEAMLRDRRNGQLGDYPIPYAELEALTYAEIEIARPLNLVDLRGDGPAIMGVPTDAVRASSCRLGKIWSLAFWSHDVAPDGIIYPSRLNEETCIALFDRALPKVKLSAKRALLDCRAEMAEVIRVLKLSIKGSRATEGGL